MKSGQYNVCLCGFLGQIRSYLFVLTGKHDGCVIIRPGHGDMWRSQSQGISKINALLS